MRVSNVMLTHSTATAMLVAMEKHAVTACSSQTVAFARELFGMLCCHSNAVGGVH